VTSKIPYSPIALFVYKRHEHTRKALESLIANAEFFESTLYIFCDGPRQKNDESFVRKTREIIKSYCLPNVIMVERKKNLGLANSIISGVTDLCEKFGKVIVVEDDLVVSEHFLDYMNKALDRYENDEQVMQISGYMFPVRLAADTNAIFLPFTTSWGWGTWERAWNQFDPKANGWQELIKNKKLRFQFNLFGEFDYFTMLKRQMAGMSDSWAIRWYWSVFKANGLVLSPPQSYIKNIGFDGSGTHGFRSAKKKISSMQSLSNKIVNMPTKVEMDMAAYYLVSKYKGQLSSGMVPWISRIFRNILVQLRLMKKVINIKKIVKSVVQSLGYEIRKKPSVCYDREAEAEGEIRKVRPYTMIPRERLIALYNTVAHLEINEVPGSYVECGVWKGGSVGLMALANLRYGKERRHVHLFDSFEEICEPDASVDGDRAVREVRKWTKNGGISGKLVPLKGVYDTFGGLGTIEGNRDLLERMIGYDPAFLHYHKGWFQETLPMDAPSIGNIAILRLDGDWYASTKVCLEYLYNKVVSGGFVIIDDYGAYDGCKKAVDEFMQSRVIRAYLHHIDMECRYWVKP